MSQLLTLFTTPIIYLVLDRWLGRTRDNSGTEPWTIRDPHAMPAE